MNGCTKWHHQTLHKDKKTETSSQGISGSASVCDNNIVDSCLLQIQQIPTKRGWVNILWDSGASLCFITNSKAKAKRLKGTKVELSIIKVEGDNEKIASNRYKLSLIAEQGQEVQFDVYRIDEITSDIQSVNVNGIVQLFENISEEGISRPSGTIDVLIGYEYAAHHPQNDQTSGHLLLLKNYFGRCIGGTHPFIKERTRNHMLDHISVTTAIVRVEDFYNIENLGIGYSPLCGGCKCGKCSLKGPKLHNKGRKRITSNRKQAGAQ